MESSLPSLKKLYETRKDQRDRFEIIAFHAGSVRDFAEFDEKVKSHVEGNWEGPLPFPVLIDDGATWKAYGVVGMPRYALLDPEGNVVRGGDEKTLEKALEDEKARAR